MRETMRSRSGHKLRLRQLFESGEFWQLAE